MASQEMRIVAIHGDTLLVDGADVSGCGGCRSKSLCGHNESAMREIRVDAAEAARLRVHDQVLIGLPSGQLLRMMSSAYLPVLCGFVLGMLGGAAAGSDRLSLLLGTVGFVAGVFVTRYLSRHRAPLVHSVTPAGGVSHLGCGS
jgi:positive regulator of sigma E activity